MEQESIKQSTVIKDFLEKGVVAKQYLDVVRVMICVIDPAGIVLSINKRGFDILGYPEEAVLGVNWIDNFVTKEHQEKVREVVAQLAVGNIAPFQYYENDIIDAQGIVHNIAFHNEVLRDDGGLVVGILFAGEDITHHKKLEKKLSEQANILEAIGEHLPIGYAVNTISDGKIVVMNKKFEDIYGWPLSVISNVDLFFENVYPDPEFRKKISEQVRADMMSADPRRMIWEHIPITRQSGETAIITAQNIPLYENNLMISTVWDVTRQVHIEKALRESEQLKRSILDNLTELVFVKDNDGRFVAANEAFLVFTGRTLEGLVGKNDFDLFDKENAGKYIRDDKEVMETRKNKAINETSVNAAGEVVQCETTKVPFLINGEVNGIIGVVRIVSSLSK
ncbi:MAG: pas/pac sensor signal transduction histidine kinase [uncultured bacterium]|uniref:PAS domain-containing protein n=2 Tax=Candidatus Wolfeibacteriota TaxID=1752735 RepID=A0A0G1H8M7_9BACT|nr:MAG: pas/pac sensor signal transduction histidine kinase [uncultured bacterium]KKR12790.1 MAG: PAS domain-containing protein [Candidatus Wolfebacteria bacterium GW2011_GWC2_39_22]KKT43721.1 MAG: PAS domain-containing protein [Candidatus Wolfebacteria bacterium GW2011_GWE2_44_13]HBI25548.1 hypothetical protein [Candidatus Wolfebacteria bacterium]